MDLTRRSLVASAGLALVGSRLLAQTPDRPPATRVEPVTTDYFGIRIADPYRWMESTQSLEWTAWLKAQADYADRILTAIPDRTAMLEAVNHYAADIDEFGLLDVAGGTIFLTRRPKGAKSFRTYVRPIAGGEERMLLDPETIHDAQGRTMAVANAAASPDGRLFAASLIPDGSEDEAAVYIFNVATGRLIGEPTPGSRLGGISWLPDSRGFFYNRLANVHPRGDAHFYDNSVCVLHLVHATKPDPIVLKSGDVTGLPRNPLEVPCVITAPNSEWVVGNFTTNIRYDGPFFIARLDDLLSGSPAWRMVSSADDHVEAVALTEDRLYLKARGAAPRSEVRMATADRPAFATARVVVPESEALISDVVASSEGIWVRGMKAGRGHLRFLSADGHLDEVALPAQGSLWGVSAQPGRSEAWLTFDDYTTFGSAFRVAGHGRPLVAEHVVAPFPFDLSRYHVERVTVTARDGTSVPLDLIKLRSLTRNGRNPVLIQAYGAYGTSMDPIFNPQFLAFLDAGGIFAVAHVRGGGEFGEEWHRAGQKATKPNTWRDAIDCGEWLISSRWSGAGRLALWGTSAGGIMVGRAITERPDLWAAAVDRVGVSDTLRFEGTQNGPSNIGEFGTVTKPDEFRWLLQMSPYQSVKDGTRYPAVLLMTAANDSRVEPWQLGKMTARLQAATVSGKPVILRVDYKAGHGSGVAADQRNRELADMFAFVLYQTRG